MVGSVERRFRSLVVAAVVSGLVLLALATYGLVEVRRSTSERARTTARREASAFSGLVRAAVADPAVLERVPGQAQFVIERRGEAGLAVRVDPSLGALRVADAGRDDPTLGVDATWRRRLARCAGDVDALSALLDELAAAEGRGAAAGPGDVTGAWLRLAAGWQVARAGRAGREAGRRRRKEKKA
jgi:hypothetical protein